MVSENSSLYRLVSASMLIAVVLLGFYNVFLFIQVRELGERYEVLEKELLGYYKVRTKWSSLSLDELNSLLKSAIEDISRITLDLGDEDGFFVIDLFKWMLLNLYYQYDPGIVHIEEKSVLISYEYLQMPSETLIRRGGDCEDLSLLVYTVLVNNGFKAWIIAARVYRLTHVFVVAWGNNTWFVIDPAANFLNEYTVVFVIEGGSRKLIIPLHLISPIYKKKLLEQGLEVKWIYDLSRQSTWFTTYILENIITEDYPNITRVNNLRDLLIAWGNNLGLPVVTLFSTFDVISINEYIRDLSFDQLVEYLSTQVLNTR